MTLLRMRTVLVLASLGAALAGCSAMGLGDHDLLDCDPDDATACDHLNTPGLCPLYHCDPQGGCAPNAVVKETCDGIDNDCNGWIDEGTVSSDDGESEELTGTLQSLGHVVLQPSGVLVVTATHGATPTSSLVDTQAFAFGNKVTAAASLFEGQTCEGGGSPLCRPKDVAIASVSDALVGAGVHFPGCASGQLRIGVGSVSPLTLEAGENTRSGLGIDTDGDGCSRTTADCDGAGQPSLAVLNPSAPTSEALLAWLAPTKQGPDDDCDPARAYRLAARPLIVDGQADPPTVSLVDAKSSLVGENTVSGPPALLACPALDEDNGYLVATPAFDRVNISFVPSHSGTLSLDDVELHEIDMPSMGAVSLAGECSAGTPGLAVAFGARLPQGPTHLHLVALRRLGRAVVSTGMAMVPAGAEVVAGPIVHYAKTGFHASPSGEPAGGWLMLWVQNNGDLMGVRIAEHGPSVIGNTFKLEEGVEGEPFIFQKHPDAAPAMLFVGFARDRLLHVREATCDVVD